MFLLYQVHATVLHLPRSRSTVAGLALGAY
jgi:hypothetical protein